MILINTQAYPQAGIPLYDQDGDIQAFGPMQVFNAHAEYKHHVALMLGKRAASKDFERYCGIGPFGDMQSYMVSMLNEISIPDNKLCQGEHKLLRLFCEWSSQKCADDSFVLAHPDLDLQNVLVDEHGNITALVDWEGVSTVPRPLGCAYPMWLTRDWDPYYYSYGYEDGRPENSPEELRVYRKKYMQYLDEAMMAGGGIVDHGTSYLSTTRQSLLVEKLRKAVMHPGSKGEIMDKVCHIVEQLSCQKRLQLQLQPSASPDEAYGQCLLEARDHGTQSGSEAVSNNCLSSHTTSPPVQHADFEGLASITPYNPPQSEVASCSRPANSQRLAATSQTTASTGIIDLASVTPNSTSPSTITIGSSSESSPTTSVFSRATDRTSTSVSMEDLTFSALDNTSSSAAASRSSPKKSPTLQVIREETSIDLATHSVAEARQDDGLNNVVVYPETRKLGKKPPRLRRTFRKVYKSLSSALAFEKKTVFRKGGPDGLTLVAVVDNTMFEIVSPRVLGSDLPILDERARGGEDGDQHDASGNPVISQVTLIKDRADVFKDDTSKADREGQLVTKSDQSNGPNGGEAVDSQLAGPPAEENTPTTSCKDKQPSPEEASIQEQQGTSFCRRAVKKLLLPCHPPEVESHPIPCRETKHDPQPLDPRTPRPKVKRAAGWIKRTLWKTRQFKPSVALVNPSPSEPENSNPNTSTTTSASSEQRHTSEKLIIEKGDHFPRPGSAIRPGTNIFDLENLEPVDEDTLWNSGFMTGQIMQDLAAGRLDDARMQRLKAGFFALLDSL